MEKLQEYSQKASSSFNGTSVLQKVILLIVVLVILYILYKFIFKKSSRKLLSLQPADEPTVVDKSSAGNLAGSYTISIWIFVGEWNKNYGKKKYVLSRTITGTDGKKKAVPAIYLDEHTNDIIVEVDYYNPSQGSSTTTESHKCRVKSIPLQKWCNITIAMNTRVLDVYIDGKLSRTCMIDGVPRDGTGSDLYVGSFGGIEQGFAGFMTDLVVYEYAINPKQAYELYKKGHSSSSFGGFADKYKLKFALLENSKEVNTLIL